MGRQTAILLQADMRQSVSGDDLVPFVIEPLEMMNLPVRTVNQRGNRSRQYPQRMMLALMIHCCANDVVSSRCAI